MRICSLLPSITEILFELGLGDDVVGVTHECDWPVQAKSRVKLTRNRIWEANLSSSEIDEQVRRQVGSLYELDAVALANLRPDLILTQSLCPVCAVDESEVRSVAATLPGSPAVVSFRPTCLNEILDSIEQIGRLTGAGAASHKLQTRFYSVIGQVQTALHELANRPRVAVLEWTNPPFACGHWTPELVSLAGGNEMLGRTGQPSRRVAWQDLWLADPEVLLIAPCGFTMDRAMQDIPVLEQQTGWKNLAATRSNRVFVTDGSAYFNRPGPRIMDSLQILASVIHPEMFEGLSLSHCVQRFSAF